MLHGSTVATNLILEHKGAKTALLTTRGFRDVLEIRRLRLENTTDFYGDKPLPPIPRDLVAEVDERLLADGSIHQPLDLGQVREAVRRLVTEA